MITEGVIPINKPRGLTSFNLVRLLRKHLGVRKIGHAGTLDPFADGVMVMLIGRKYTRLSDLLLKENKE
ncbi:MAG: tRNA pseudouridine(55) synthase TruB, partial [Waddliaceae bacterium]